MVHGKAMSSLRLDTLGAKPPPQSPQLAMKDSNMERCGRGEDAGGWLRTRRKGPLASLRIFYYNLIEGHQWNWC